MLHVSLTQPGTHDVAITAEPPRRSKTVASARHNNTAAAKTVHTTTAVKISTADDKPPSIELTRNGFHQSGRYRVHDDRPTSNGGEDLRRLELASLTRAGQRSRAIASRARPARRRHRAQTASALVRTARHLQSLEGRSPASNGPGVAVGLGDHNAATSWPAACTVGATRSRGIRTAPHDEHGSQPHHDVGSRSLPMDRNGLPWCSMAAN
mmetsp:Transcript_9043/g.21591  ORF Transcript_9043/g.21591 Transcript_9043/m.21591 type:complete len:210 (+) Transcript_9043:1005-1634(+)